MPATLTALFASAIHQARMAADPDQSGINRATTLLVAAAGARRVHWHHDGEHLEVNGTPIAEDAPGAHEIGRAFANHPTRTLGLPAGLTSTQWAELAMLYASAPGLYPTAAHFRAALAGTVSGVIYEATSEPPPVDPRVDDALRETPGPSAFAAAVSPEEAGNQMGPDAVRSSFSATLDPLLVRGRAAVATADWVELAAVLDEMSRLAASGDDASRAILLNERRRMAPEPVLRRFVRDLSESGHGVLVERTAAVLRADGAGVLLDAIADGLPRHLHRTYLELLTEMPDAPPVLVRALGAGRPETVEAAAEVLGRRRFEPAVPVLGALLKHREARVRTAAWRALETIGTTEAIRLMQ